jgi:hypothetical protein
MGFFDLFTNKNSDTLNRDEKQAAEILKNILVGYQNGDPNFIPNGVEQLAVGLYYLAFKRTNKKLVRIEEFVSIDAIFGGNYKGLHYASVYEAIKETIVKTCNNPVMLKSSITLQDCEKAILVTLKTAATRISQI